MNAGGHVVALVPARGGSKSLPRKNVMPVAGHPLIAWSIAAGTLSDQVDEVICSTDDDEIADVARQYGATVLRRPADLAADDTPDLPVFQHALDHLITQGRAPRAFVHLRPTAPLRPAGLVQRCVAALDEFPDATSVRTVAPAPHTPYKMWTDGADSPFLSPLLTIDGMPEPYNMPRQALPPVWWHNGSVDVIRSEIIAAGSMTGPRIVPVRMRLEDSVDIDDAIGLLAAELRIARRRDVVAPAATPWLADVDLVMSDVDGTLTPGTMHYGINGEQLKSFHTRDGMGVQLLREAGIVVALVTGEATEIVTARAAKLTIEHVVLGASDKRHAVTELLQRLGHDGQRAVFLGDDVNDIPAATLLQERGGHFVAVADAHPSVLAVADIRLSSIGGSGALRELADRILEGRASRQPTFQH